MLGLILVAVSAKAEKIGAASRGLQKFPHAPDVIRDLSFHRGRHAKALVDPAEIVEGEPHYNSGPVVLPFLAVWGGERLRRLAAAGED